MTSDPGSLRTGLCSISFRELRPTEIIERAAEAGLDGIEWGADGHVPAGDLTNAAEVADRTTAAGLACPSYGTYLGVDPAKGTPEEICETAATLGATNIRVWARFGHDHNTPDDVRAEITTEIAGFAEHAARHDLTVGIECHGWTLTDTAESARRLVADIGADHVFSYWQPNYWDPAVNADDDQQVAELELLHPDLSHLHVYWWYGLQDRCALDEGAGTWVRALEVARRPNRWNAERYAFLEYVPDDDPELLTREAATLRGWLNR